MQPLQKPFFLVPRQLAVLSYLATSHILPHASLVGTCMYNSDRNDFIVCKHYSILVGTLHFSSMQRILDFDRIQGA